MRNKSDYVKGMKKEYKELYERTSKLMDFMDTEKFGELPLLKKEFLLLQSGAMAVYAQILNFRLNLENMEDSLVSKLEKELKIK